jgi:transcriptional regulator with XRE-family HTH domain
MSFRKKLKQVIKKKGLTQSELAKRMGISRSLVCQIVRGHRKPYPKFCHQAAKVLGVSVNELIGSSVKNINEKEQGVIPKYSKDLVEPKKKLCIAGPNRTREV